MSPRRADPAMRSNLIDVAARILRDEGPGALTARRVAAEAGTSTMVIYTHFGRMHGLVLAIVREGFSRLQSYFSSVRWSDDPVADMALLGRAYRRNAMVNPYLYSIMFGSISLDGFALTDAERHCGRFTLRGVTECAVRCVVAGRFREADPEFVAERMWCGVHGVITLEMGDYLNDAETVLDEQLTALMIGAGDDRASARRSVLDSKRRLAAEYRSWLAGTPPQHAVPGAAPSNPSADSSRR